MTTRHREVIRETLERITIRYRKGSRTAYCSSCGKPTVWLTAEQAAEIFGAAGGPVESAHSITEPGSVRLLCAESMIARDDDEAEKE